MKIQGCPNVLAALMPFAFLACSESTGPDAEATCIGEPGTVDVTVSPGTAPSFSWSPACPVAMILIEDGASDMWGAVTDDALWDDPASANLITPPVTYGSSLSGTTSIEGPLPLIAGTTYEVILWRILPDSSTAVCQQRFDNACLMAVHPFVP